MDVFDLFEEEKLCKATLFFYLWFTIQSEYVTKLYILCSTHEYHHLSQLYCHNVLQTSISSSLHCP